MRYRLNEEATMPIGSVARRWRVALPGCPGRRNRKRVVRYDQQRHCMRYFIEDAICRLKDVRHVATRYNKLAANFLSGVALATAVAFWL
jgi:hypothetical protein